ncbi:hypothetical protein V2J09_015253 [Rumex salicifolius]
MSVNYFSLVFNVVFVLLFSFQASCARHFIGILPYSKDLTAQEKRLLLNLSHKNDDGTNIPLKENAKLLKEQQKDSITPTESDQENNFEGGKKDRKQALKSGPILEPNNKDIAKDDSKIVKSQINLSSARNPTTVSWRLHQQKRKRKRKNRGISHDPELTLDYAPPRVHPPCHN